MLRRAIAATVAAVATASDVALLTADTAYAGLLRWAIEASVAAGAATCRGRHSPAGRDAADARRCRRCDHPRKLRWWGLPQPREGDQSAVSLNGVGRHSPAVSGDHKGRRRRWRRDSTDILATHLGGRMQGELKYVKWRQHTMRARRTTVRAWFRFFEGGERRGLKFGA